MINLLIGFIDLSVAMILIKFNYVSLFELSYFLLVLGGYRIGKRIERRLNIWKLNSC